MKGLSDMEELLGRIESKGMVDYMREAVGCYHAGAYRACIVLSYIALFADLAEKLHELARTNSTAKKISNEVKQRQSDQQVFETYMVDQLKSAKLITEAEASTLEQVRVCRNKAAHPSGVHASPEEARFVYFEVIDKFLSKRLLLTTQAVDALILRLSNANFFPTTDIKETRSIVESELASLHEAVFPYLIEQLVQACNDPDQNTEKNAQRFIVGLSYLRRDTLTPHIRKRLVKAKAESTDYQQVILRAASANPNILDDHDAPTMIRIRSLLEAAVDETKTSIAVTQFSHPIYLLSSLLDAFGEERVLTDFTDLANKIVNNYRYSGSLVKILLEAPTLKKTWLKKLKREAGSSTYDTANRFAGNISDIDEQLGELIEPKDAFELVVFVCDAANTGAFTSQSLRSGQFLSVPKLRDLAIMFTKKRPKEANKIVKESGVSQNLEVFLETYLADDE